MTSLPEDSLALYHGVGGLDELVGAYGSLARALIAIPSDHEHRDNPNLVRLNQLGDGRLRELLERAVIEEEMQGERDIARLYLLERIILGTTLVLLLLECFFIFIPTISIVRMAMGKEEEHSDKLRHEVGQREKAIKDLTKAQRTLEKLSIVPKYSGDGTVLLNNRGEIEWVNQTFCSLSGWSMGEVIGRVPSEVLTGSDVLEDFEREVAGSVGTLDSWQRQVKIKRRSGESIWVDVGVNVVKAQGNHAQQIVAVFRDITEMVRHREMLEDSNAKADAANLAKTQFLANMSHEIRTPMNGILGMNYLLLGTDLDEDQKEYAETVQASSEHLLSVINNILDLSKLEAGETEMLQRPFSMKELIDGAIGAVRGIAIQKELTLETSSEFPDDAIFTGDIDHLRQVLINVLGNAVKFTDEGEISLDVTKSQNGVTFTIADTGVGMATDELPHLFDRFYQVDGSATRKKEGSGLGLAICKEILDHMGGKVVVDSGLDQGTTFRIEIPMTQMPGEQQQDQTARSA